MTMITGFCYETFGVLAYDSRLKRFYEDGTVQYGDGPRAFGTFRDGFVTASGTWDVADRAIRHLEGTRGTLDELAEGLAPVLSLACAEVGDVPGSDPARTRILLLTAASGEAEMGVLSAREGLTRVPPGQRVFSRPGDGDRDAIQARWEHFKDLTHHPGSGYRLLRQIGSLYADVAEMTPSVSGRVTVALLQRPGDRWQPVSFEERAEVIANASDGELSDLFNTIEVPA